MSQVPANLPDVYRREGPVVTVIGDEEGMNFDDARPSPVMLLAGRFWRACKTTTKVGLLVGLAGLYPAMMWSAHEIDDASVDAEEIALWPAPEAGVAISLIAREVEGPGWTGDLPAWRPASQLTAQPAWQDALMVAIADFAQLSAAIVAGDGETDPDLAAAGRLLRPVETEDMTPRLVAGAEALARYSGRVDHGLAGRLDTNAELAQTVGLFANWAQESGRDIGALVGAPDGWPAGQNDVTAFYRARARAHVSNNMLKALAANNPDLEMSASLRAQWREVEMLWERIADQSPLMVSNQEGDGLFLPNHLASMAWHLEQAGEATAQLAELLQGAKPDTALAEADIVILTTSP